MPESQTDRAAALAALDVFVGEWVVEVAFPGSPTGRVVFEWALDGRYLLQRSSAPDPVPDSLAVIALGDEADPYRQHYFRLARGDPPLPDGPRRRRLDAAAHRPGLLPAGLLATLRGHLLAR